MQSINLKSYNIETSIAASFRTDLLQELSIQSVHPEEFEKVRYTSSKVLNTHAPIRENKSDVTNLPS